MNKLIALLIVAALAMTAAVFAEETDIEMDLDHLVVGNPTPMRGEFFTEMWGNSTSDIDVRSLVHGYDIVMWNADYGAFIPDESVVAEIEYLNDENANRSFHITLADDLYWSDGSKITAWDYAFSYLLSIAPEVVDAGGKPIRREHLLGYDAYLNGEVNYLAGVQVFADDELYITLDHRYLPFFYELGLIMCNPYPISVIAPGVEVRDDGDGVYLANIDERIEEPLFTGELLKQTVLDPVNGYMSHPSLTCGPYKVISWDGVTVELEINPFFKGDHKGDMPLIQYLTYTLAENDTMIEKLRNNEFGLLNKVLKLDSVEAGIELQTEDAFSMTNYLRTGMSYISFICEHPTVAEEEVRQAIAWCLDRDALIAEYTGDNGLRVDGYYGLGQWMYRVVMGVDTPPVQEPEDKTDTKAMAEYEEELKKWEELSLDNLVPYTVDTDKASELLDKAGWTLNEDGVREKEIDDEVITLDLKLIYPEGNSTNELFEKYFIPNLESVGIKLSMEAVPMNELLSRYYKQGERDMDMIYMASNFDIVFDPSVNFIVDEEGNPNWAYTNDTDEELYRLALDMTHTEPGAALEYMQKWIKFQERFNTTLPMLPVYGNVYFDFYTSMLQEYYVEANVTWGQAIIGAFLGEPLEEAEDEGEEEFIG